MALYYKNFVGSHCQCTIKSLFDFKGHICLNIALSTLTKRMAVYALERGPQKREAVNL